jgi:chromosomal replication initiation ATPase DnaA
MQTLQLRLHEEHKERQGRMAEAARQAMIRQRRIENIRLATDAVKTAGGKDEMKAQERELKRTEFIWAGRHDIRPRSTKREEILYQVLDETGLTKEQLLGRQKLNRIVEARHWLCWRLYRETTMSMTAVGNYLDRDHTSVLNGIRRHEKRMNGWVIMSGKLSVPPTKMIDDTSVL